MPPEPPFRPRAIFFDFMGTCLDWHSSVVSSLPSSIPHATRSDLALALRAAFFAELDARFAQGLPPEDIDVAHRRLLDELLASDERFAGKVKLGDDERQAVVNAFHTQQAWPDIAPALSRLRDRGYELFVLANGTTRLQLDLVRSAFPDGVSPFSMLFSSQLLNLTKPDPEFYLKALRLVDAQPHEALMVASHAYDLRAAKEVGMRTAYVRRWTEDQHEEFGEVMRGEFELFLGEIGDVVDGDRVVKDGAFDGLERSLS